MPEANHSVRFMLVTIAIFILSIALVALTIGFGSSRLIEDYWPITNAYFPIAAVALILFVLSIYRVLRLIWVRFGPVYRRFFWPVAVLFLIFAVYVLSIFATAVVRVATAAA